MLVGDARDYHRPYVARCRRHHGDPPVARGDAAAPFLIISALGEVDERVRGLRAGGDDYLVKPFSFVELLARIEALGRRSDVIAKETILRVGDLAIDLIDRTASRRGNEIDLLPREFQLLEYLVRNEGRVISRAMLLQHVWDLHFDPSTNIIDVYVGRVRRKVDDRRPISDPHRPWRRVLPPCSLLRP